MSLHGRVGGSPAARVTSRHFDRLSDRTLPEPVEGSTRASAGEQKGTAGHFDRLSDRVGSVTVGVASRSLSLSKGAPEHS